MARGLVTKVAIEADAQGKAPTSIQLLHTGTWKAPWHGEWETTPADLEEYARNFEAGVGLVAGDKRAPLNFGHDGSGEAAGWMTRVYTQNGSTELWADVEWTKDAREAIEAGKWKYISPEFNPRSYPWEDPEEEYHFVANVLTAAALTNIPLFKGLKPVMASAVKPKPVKADSKKTKEGESMKLEDVRAKKLEDLTEEEKTFLEEHKTELTAEERATFSLETDEEKATREADEKKAANEAKKTEEEKLKASRQGQVTISASELATLKANAEAGLKASQALEQRDAEEFVSQQIKAGRIKSGEKENTVKMLLASADRTAFKTFIESLPANTRVNANERGDGGGNAKSAQDELMAEAQKRVDASKDGLTLNEAVKNVLADNGDLRDRVNAERK